MTNSIERRLSWHRRALLRIVPPVVAALLRLLGATLRYESVFEQGGHADQPGEPAVWCFWHRCLLTAACYFRGRPRTTLLISASFDGELIARTIERLGYETVRGSSSRAGAAGLRALATVVQQGTTGVIPGDGPRGPCYLLKPGVAKLARLTDIPIYSFYLLPQRAWVLRSWDALLVPRPFSRVVIVWGRPVPAPQSVEQEETTRLEAEQTLERLRALAEARFATSRAAAQ
jgi:lysophospholipid acyltransferase (LPLAT)-like uncharacterized protein